jgi:hypothetical protein
VVATCHFLEEGLADEGVATMQIIADAISSRIIVSPGMLE